MSYNQQNSSISSFSTLYDQNIEVSNLVEIMPLHVELSYETSKLEFKINCSKMSSQNSNSRYYFIYDQNLINQQKLNSLIDTFYSNIQFGDLIKIINLNNSCIKHNSWVEKTKSKTQIKNLLSNKQITKNVNTNDNLINILRKVFIQSQKYSSNYVSIAVFLGKQFNLNHQLFLNLQTQKLEYKYFYNLTIFTQNTINFTKQTYTIKIITVPQGRWQNKIINYLTQIKQIILKNISIKIQCLNGALIKTNQNQSNKNWVWKGNSLTKEIYSLSKYICYTQSLKLTNPFNKILLYISISFQTLKGFTYSMYGCIQITGIDKQIYKTQNHTTIINNSSVSSISSCIQTVTFSKNKLLVGEI